MRISRDTLGWNSKGGGRPTVAASFIVVLGFSLCSLLLTLYMHSQCAKPTEETDPLSSTLQQMMQVAENAPVGEAPERDKNEKRIYFNSSAAAAIPPEHTLNVVYCLDMTYEGYMPGTASEIFRQSVLSIIQHSPPQTVLRLRIYIFHTNEERKSIQVLESLQKFVQDEYGLRVVMVQTSADIVTPNRKVWGYKDPKHLGRMVKLTNPANYLRFYLPELLPDHVSKFFYLDYDVVTVGDLATVFDNHANGNVALAAGVQNVTCSAGKTLVLGDERLAGLGLQATDPCIASAIMIINRKAWLDQKRREGLERWLAENKRKKLWHLGSMPPLMTEFAGEWEHLPPDLVIDNKRDTFAANSTTAIQKGGVLLHPVKDPRFVYEQRIWLQVTINTEFDMPMIPHLVSHYLSTGLRPHYFLVVLYNQNAYASEQQEAIDLLHRHGIDHVLPWSGDYNSEGILEQSQQLRADANVDPDDWVVHTESDQLHEFPLKDVPTFLRIVHELRYDAIYGYYVDRVSEDGSLRSIAASPSLPEQFPLSCHISTQVVELNPHFAERNVPSKLVAFKGKFSENPGGEKLLREVEACVYPTRLRTHSYKWAGAAVSKMEQRVSAEKSLSGQYQLENVLEHLRSNSGKIGVMEGYLRCQREEVQRNLPVTPRPVDVCKKFKYREEELARLPPGGSV